MHDWGDLKFFLATARSGSTLAAGRELGVNATTVARRIAALERALSIRLFDRNNDGYRLSEAGNAILIQAERAAAEMETLERMAAQRSRNLSGVIRVTTVESLANSVLTPLLSEFFELYPDIKVEVITAERLLDLARGEADIAIRACQMPAEPGITVRKLADEPWALYCSRAYAAKRGVPKSGDDLNQHAVVGGEGVLAKLDPFKWLAKVAPRATVRSVCSTVANTIVAIKAGHGVGPLPCGVKRFGGSDLVECFPMPSFGLGWYFLTRSDMRDLPRVKAFSRFMAPALKRVLEGRASKGRQRAKAMQKGR
jgi:DNA-binding transcriptional LysR family regulator